MPLVPKFCKHTLLPKFPLPRYFSIDNNGNSSTSNDKKEFPETPSVPCCMQGCANCVWLEYADKLTEYFKDGGESARKEIEKSITEPNMKAYLLYELCLKAKEKPP